MNSQNNDNEYVESVWTKRRQGLKSNKFLREEIVNQYQMLNNQQNYQQYFYLFSIFISISILMTYIGYMTHQVIYYERNSYSMIQDYKDYQNIGELHIFRDAKVFPVIEMKIIDNRFDQLGIIDSTKTNTTTLDLDLFYTDIYIDYHKIRKYIQFQLVYEIKQGDQTVKRVARDFQNCNQSHIKAFGLEQEQFVSNKTRTMFCPDFQFFQNILKIQNDYSSQLRHSFEIQIIKCTMGSNCKSDKDIQNFLNMILINEFLIKDNINIVQKPTEFKKHPLKKHLCFLQQLKLDFNSYRDNNNFIKQNEVNLQDNIFTDYISKQIYVYDVDHYPIYLVHNKVVLIAEISEDGITVRKQQRHVFASTFFFLTNKYTRYERKVFNFTDVLIRIGSFISIIVFIQRIFYNYLIEPLLMGGIIFEIFKKKNYDSKTSIMETTQENLQGYISQQFLKKKIYMLHNDGDLKKILKRSQTQKSNVTNLDGNSGVASNTKIKAIQLQDNKSSDIQESESEKEESSCYDQNQELNQQQSVIDKHGSKQEIDLDICDDESI